MRIATRGRRLPVLALIGALLSAHPGAAQEHVALVSSRSYTPITDKTFVVEAADTSELNERLATVISAELQKRGYTIADEAAVELAFDLQTLPIVPRARSVQGAGRNASNTDPDTVGVRINLNRPKTGKLQGHNRYRLSIRMTNGRTSIWSGSATAYVTGSDRFTVGSALTRVLIAALNSTVEAENRQIFLRPAP